MVVNRLLVLPALILAAALWFAPTSTVAWVVVAMAATAWVFRSAPRADTASSDAALPEDEPSEAGLQPEPEAPAAATDTGAGLVISFERLQQIEQTERLAALGQLSAGIAHEINNPVAYVDSNLRELQEDFDSLRGFIKSMDGAADLIGRDHPATQHMIAAYRQNRIPEVLEFLPDRLEDAVNGIERIGQIVRDMKRLVKGGHGPKVPCVINEELQAIVNIAKTRLKGGLSLHAELLDVSPTLLCNASQIGQVVLNILVNAIQAVDPESGHIRLLERLHERELELVIEDNGPGMTDEVREKIFDPFFTTKGDDDGTGMGLSLSMQLVREHNGRIEVESEAGKGTTFRIFLPLPREEESGNV